MTAHALGMTGDRGDSGPESEGMARDLSACLLAAMQRHGVSIQEVAFWWGCDASFVSRVLSDEKNLTDKLIRRLPRWLQRATHAEWASDLDVLVGKKAAAQKALEGLRALFEDDEQPAQRMAKATLDDARAVKVRA